MATYKDTQAANIIAGAATPVPDATEASSSAETPKIEPEIPAVEPETPAVTGGALALAVRAQNFSSNDAFSPSDAFESHDAEPEVTEATVINSSRWRMPGHAPLAAGIVLAVAI